MYMSIFRVILPLFQRMLDMSLVSERIGLVQELDDDGYTCTFGNNSWKMSKGTLSIARGSKTSTLYVLHVSKFSNHVICIAKHPSVSLWHSRLGHVSKSRMQVLSHSGYILGLNFFDFLMCEHCLYGK